MKLWGPALILMSVFCTVAMAAKGPEVDFVDSRLSINAEAVPLGRLIQLVDRATGMASKVPPELANRNISVKFSSLTLSDAVRKIFQGQPLDYVVIQGKSIIVTGTSQATPGGTVATNDSFNSFNSQPVQNIEQPTFQDFTNNNQQFPPNNQQFPQPQIQAQPAMVQTPFGPIPNPRAQQPNAPGANAQPQNSLFPQPGQQLGQPALGSPTNAPGAVPPGGLPTFGTPSTFGAPQAPGANPNNSLFGNLPGTQQR